MVVGSNPAVPTKLKVRAMKTTILLNCFTLLIKWPSFGNFCHSNSGRRVFSRSDIFLDEHSSLLSPLLNFSEVLVCSSFR